SHRKPRLMNTGEVVLDEIRIAALAGVLMMQNVVLVDPGVGKHPVGPIQHSPAAASEHARGVAPRNVRHPVVAAVSYVMHQKPARRAAERESGSADRIR